MSWSAPVNFMANVLDNIQHDPGASKIMLGVGLAWDVMRHVPPDLYANIPHFETEVDRHVGNDAGNGAGGSPA